MTKHDPALHQAAARMLNAVTPESIKGDLKAFREFSGLPQLESNEEMALRAGQAQMNLTDDNIDFFLDGYDHSRSLNGGHYLGLSTAAEQEPVFFNPFLAEGQAQEPPAFLVTGQPGRGRNNGLAPVPFEGKVEFFADKGSWHVGLSGGGLDKQVRLEPRKGSPTAEVVTNFVRDTHVRQVLAEALEVVRSKAHVLGASGSVERGQAVVLMTRYPTGGGLLSDAEQLRASISVRQGVLLATCTGGAELMMEINWILGELVSRVPEYAGMTFAVLRPGQEKAQQAPEASITAVGSHGVSQGLLPAGSDTGHISITSMSLAGASLHTGLLVMHDENVVMSAEKGEVANRLGDLAVELMAKRGLDGGMIRLVHLDEWTALETNHFSAAVRYNVDAEMGYVEMSTDLPGESRVGTGLLPFTFQVSDEVVRVVIFNGITEGDTTDFARHLPHVVREMAQSEKWLERQPLFGNPSITAPGRKLEVIFG